MPIMVNTILRGAGIDPRDVRLIRHKDKRANKGLSPYELWRDDRPSFDLYQSSQQPQYRASLSGSYWAVFLGTLTNETMFAGLYRAHCQGPWDRDTPAPHIRGEVIRAGSCDAYSLELDSAMSDLAGRLYIDWGKAAIKWIQRADRQDKVVTELRSIFQEEAFPGFHAFIQPLSRLERLPTSWMTALKASRGVYLLTCPRTREQYVGSATGGDGFWGRWLGYMATGHGGNTGLQSRDPSDYQVSILEVAASSASERDILALEGRWQMKLQSQAMGLNRNLARRQST